jgi:hypothetical protein
VAASACNILNDQGAIATAAHANGLAENQLPTIFSAAQAWKGRLQSEVEAGAALTALIDRADLIDTGIRVSLKVPATITEERPGANATELVVTRVFPMQIRRRGFEMRLIIEANGTPAPRADLALLKAVAWAHRWSDDLLTGRALNCRNRRARTDRRALR